MILEKEVRMVINQYNIDYYQKVLGKNLKIGQRIKVPVDLLPSTSGVKITTICEYCGQPVVKAYRRYIESMSRGKICCNHCKQQKIEENCLIKYGNKCTLRVPEIHQKMVRNNMEKYGTEHSVTPDSIQKRNKTMMERYGSISPLSNTEIREKAYQKMYLNGKNCGCMTSKQQVHINELVNGVLNYPVGPYHVDCFLVDKNIGIEYNGGGHSLSVKFGRQTQKQFDAKERARHSYFINHKIPIIEIQSQKDKLPEDQVLKSMIEEAINTIAHGCLYVRLNLDN